MDWTQMFFTVFGGLGLFLMGMKIMSESMQKVAGENLRRILGILTTNRFMGVFVGFLITAIIQSSSATTVMTVGFVNASLITMRQAIGVVLGANIGTTVTGWIVTLKIVKYSLPLIGTGVMMLFFSRKQNLRYIGEILFGFGLLFLGMTIMKSGFAPLRESEAFIELFNHVNTSGYAAIFWGIAIGAFTTLVIQSSSATIGISIALASQGLLSFEGAVAVILGGNIGTTITAQLAIIGASIPAKRTAMAHTLFNVLGVVIILFVFVPYIKMIDWMIPGSADMTITAAQATEALKEGTKPYIGEHIAMAHTLFNIGNVLVFIPLIGFLAKVCEAIWPETKESKEAAQQMQFKHLSHNLISTPAIGILEAHNEIEEMALRVSKNAGRIRKTINEHRDFEKTKEKIIATEKRINRYRIMITEFLLSLSEQQISHHDSIVVGNYITLAHNLEKYADYVINISFRYQAIAQSKKVLSDTAELTLTKVLDSITEYYQITTNGFSSRKKISQHFLGEAVEKKRELKDTIQEAKIAHFERLREGACNNEASLGYTEMLTDMDGMVSQVFNIAEIVSNSKFSE
ncbi:Na/Pi cotransporter family protein [bacterium]|nr:Na/Pi cotransporter family protein [bacterium]